jgi:glycosyltransferase involved in cell wall biosynthesis
VEIDAVPVSVVMTTYNHEKYIAEAIRSTLDQTFATFELIIVNDGSTDKTDEVIRNFLPDPRITYICQENQGTSVAANNGILKARGKYIALMSGDDISYPERLQNQYQYLHNTEKKIAFSWVDFINDESQPLIGKHFAKKLFNYGNKSRAEILNYFFLKGNYLCAVTAFLERQIIIDAGLFHLSSIQLQDFDMWIKLVKQHEIFIIPEKLVKYRVRSEANNLSHPANNYTRACFETYQIYRVMFDNLGIDLFKESFGDRIKNRDFQDGAEYELEKSFLYLQSNSAFVQSIGMEKLFHLLQEEKVLAIAKKQYNFDLPQFYKLTQNLDIKNSMLVTAFESSKFWKIYQMYTSFKQRLGLR